jgi:hypothetical protein
LRRKERRKQQRQEQRWRSPGEAVGGHRSRALQSGGRGRTASRGLGPGGKGGFAQVDLQAL